MTEVPSRSVALRTKLWKLWRISWYFPYSSLVERASNRKQMCFESLQWSLSAFFPPATEKKQRKPSSKNSASWCRFIICWSLLIFKTTTLLDKELQLETGDICSEQRDSTQDCRRGSTSEPGCKDRCYEFAILHCTQRSVLFIMKLCSGTCPRPVLAIAVLFLLKQVRKPLILGSDPFCWDPFGQCQNGSPHENHVRMSKCLLGWYFCPYDCVTFFTNCTHFNSVVHCR